MSAISLDLPANLTIANAEALYETLEPLLLKDSDVELVGEHIERVDTAGLQLLLAFKLALGKRKVGFSWKNYSPVVVDGARQIGIDSLLAFDSKMSK